MREFTPIALDAALRAGMTILCTTPTLAQHLRDRYADLQIESGKRVWRTPSVLAWQAWLRRTYEQLLDAGAVSSILLTTPQERLIWEDIISDWDLDNRLLRTDGAVRNALAAARICRRYGIEHAALENAHGPETDLFLEWLTSFEGQLEQQSWRSISALDEIIAEVLLDGRGECPDAVVVAGFDDHSAAETRVLEALAQRGASLYQLDDRLAADTVTRYVAADPDEELDWVARWAADCHQTQPNARIGIACVDLAACRDALEMRLSRFYPSTEALTFAVSPAPPLSHHPHVHAALLFLRLLSGSLSRAEANYLLQCASFAQADETPTTTATLVTRLDASPLRQFNLHALVRILATPDEQPLARIDGFARVARELRTQADATDLYSWSRGLARWLRLAGWLASRDDPHMQRAVSQSFDDERANTRERVREMFGELARLSPLHANCEAPTAVARLRALCESAPMSSAPATPIKVVSVDEAAHMRFDFLWVLQLDDEHWPRGASPNPLLPVRLQRQARVPLASAHQALELAQQQTRKLVGAATHVCFSHAAKMGDRELRISPLVEYVEPLGNAAIQWPAMVDLPAERCATAARETLPDDTGRSIAAGTQVTGGTRFLSDQSDCPFRAYATHRLLTDREDEAVLGLDRRDAGTLLHQALENVWKALKTSSGLQALDDTALLAVVNTAIKSALKQVANRADALRSPRYAEIELQRLNALIIEWLELERQREQPFAVLTQESRTIIDIGPLRLDVRADRVDELSDGQVVVLDYKSGNVSIKGWTDDRISEPQVPLYAVAHGENVAGAFVAQVKRSECRFKGAARSQDIVPTRKNSKSVEVLSDNRDWTTQLESWHQRLTQLADEAASGLATVTPVNLTTTCRYCSLQPACRINANVETHTDDEQT